MPLPADVVVSLRRQYLETTHAAHNPPVSQCSPSCSHRHVTHDRLAPLLMWSNRARMCYGSFVPSGAWR